MVKIAVIKMTIAVMSFNNLFPLMLVGYVLMYLVFIKF